MDVPQPLIDLGYDPAMTASLFAVFKDALATSINQALADSPPLVSSPGTELKAMDELKAVDLRMSLLMGKIPDDFVLLIDAKTFAKLLSISSKGALLGSALLGSGTVFGFRCTRPVDIQHRR